MVNSDFSKKDQISKPFLADSVENYPMPTTLIALEKGDKAPTPENPRSEYLKRVMESQKEDLSVNSEYDDNQMDQDSNNRNVLSVKSKHRAEALNITEKQRRQSVGNPYMLTQRGVDFASVSVSNNTNLEGGS